MDTFYEKNGLVFWNEQEIRVREMMMNHFREAVMMNLLSQNRAWQFMRVEAPLLTPSELIDKQYTADDIFELDDTLALRPETTMGSYRAAITLLKNHSGTKLPLCIWQYGKSFRKEQDQPLTKMRLKEFYQLEFQCLYSPTTAKNYAIELMADVQRAVEELLGLCKLEASDRLPKYAEWTKDIVWQANDMELASISKRTDFEGVCNIEVAIGMDRCVRCFFLKNRPEKNSEISG
jgi:glycyl-tRNA synthetase